MNNIVNEKNEIKILMVKNDKNKKIITKVLSLLWNGR